MPRGARRAGAASRSCTSYAGARAARSQGTWPPGARRLAAQNAVAMEG